MNEGTWRSMDKSAFMLKGIGNDAASQIKKSISLCLVWTCFASPVVVATTDNSLEDLLEGLIGIEVVSASKKAERLIDAPTSISVISRAEIQRAGATSIAEALRLVPGMIISEQRNGHYDVNIRGFDIIPPDLPAHQTASKNLLVMVDNRVVYDHTWGTVPWHDLSVAVEDVERIEVVRGPASALYGPNAFTGVIHIITRQPSSASPNKSSVSARVQVGEADTILAHSAIEFSSHDGAWKSRLSANIDARDRHQETLYSAVNDEYQRVDERFPTNFIVTLGPDLDGPAHFPDISQANDRKALNLFLHYDNSYGRTLDIDIGYTTDQFIKVGYLNAATPFNTFESTLYFGNVHYREDNLSLQFYINGSTTDLIDEVFLQIFSEIKIGVRH